MKLPDPRPRPAAWLALVLAVLLLGAGSAAAAQTVRIGVYQNAPKVDLRDGRAEGIFIELIEAIARAEGWQLEYVPGTFAQGLARAERGAIDLMPDVALTPARQALLAFHREPVMLSWSQVYARHGSGIRTILDLSGRRVAVLEGSIQQSFLAQLATSYGVPSPVLVPFPDYPAAFRAAAAGGADAVVSSPLHANRYAPSQGLEDTAIIFAPSRLFFAASKRADPALLEAIDRRLSAYKADGGSVYYAALRRWTSVERPAATPWWFKWAAVTAGAVLALALGWALTLHRATVRLRASERVQRQQAEELARIFDRSLDVICVLDGRLRFIQVSQAAGQLLGYPPEALRGRSALELLPPEDRGKALEGFRRILDGGAPGLLESRALRRDGSIAHMVWSVAWSPAQGELYCIARDETERRQLHSRLEARSAQLQRANEDLHAFAQSVSHDLRAPLAAIKGFVAKVLRDSGGQLGERSRSLLDRVLAAGERMERLIEDLLRLARVAEAGLERSRCDLSAMAADIVEGLRQAHPQRQVQVAIEPGLAASADPRLLRLALENLLDNAWKFTSRTPQAALAVGRDRSAGPGVFYVRDNGAGFPMEYAGKLFAPFQRLHHRGEFEGTGIGLSIVHRIVTRHGGRIWAEAAPGAGAVFRFTLEDEDALGDAVSRGGSPPS